MTIVMFSRIRFRTLWYCIVGDYDDAIAEHEVELAVSESLQDGLDIAVAHRRIGECHCELGQYDKAVHHQKQHLRWAQSASNAVEEQRAHATLGRTHLCSSETSRGRLATQAALGQAQASFLRSLEVCQRLREKVPHAEFMEMKARIYLNLGETLYMGPCVVQLITCWNFNPLSLRPK